MEKKDMSFSSYMLRKMFTNGGNKRDAGLASGKIKKPETIL